ncbi:polygalacturonase [Coffea arabica]|uniref:Polygalacturonase n=1 Tax=Coffea arabica TaxID=13443 RepID=A0A6P6SNF3_COFAR
MTLHTKFFAHLIVTFLFLVSCPSAFHGDLHDHSDIQQTGYDSEAYPSFLSTVDGSQFDNSMMFEAGASDGLTKLSRLESSGRIINVDRFGAKGNGAEDDSNAFQSAWREACLSTVAVTLVVSQGKDYLLKPVKFSGPCKSEITVQINGVLLASDDRSDYGRDGRQWIRFDSVQGLIVEGRGVINGRGNIWWQNSCKINKALPCKDAPTAVIFYNCKNLVVQNLRFQDAQQIHMAFEKCINVQASNLIVTAPEESPNTDGIHVTNTQNIQISGCTIGTGDDCISIVSGSQNVQATDITCGPGHGISIGSLGSENSEAHVSDVTVHGARLSGTTNGVRIKTWQGAAGSVSNIKFQNIQVHDVQNPIIIDQNYCDQATPCTQQHTAIQISNVLYQNIYGTSASAAAINLNCSKSFPCRGIVLQNVNLVREGGGAAKASCNNVNLSNVGLVSPRCA